MKVRSIVTNIPIPIHPRITVDNITFITPYPKNIVITIDKNKLRRKDAIQCFFSVVLNIIFKKELIPNITTNENTIIINWFIF